MNASQVLDHFDRICNAPDAIPRLRRFLLDLAVRGRLVEQDPSDEPASELLKRIQEEKGKLTKDGKTGKHNRVRDNAEAELPFPVPETWEWTPATYLTVLISDVGKKLQTKDVLQAGKFPVVDQGKTFIRGYCNDADKVIYVKEPVIIFGDHTRETKLVDFNFVVGADGVKILKPIQILPAYYFLTLQWLPLDSRGYGRHFKLLRAMKIPLPPLAEQHRIVAKVDELMTLFDRLEALQAERETRRDKLAAASLARLNNGADPDEFREHARFHLRHLPRFTTRPEHLQQLRQTILNLAVRGKLVPQDPKDQPTTELLKLIQMKKKQRGSKENIDPLIKMLSGGMQFKIPPSWVWVCVRDIALRISDGVHKKPTYVKEGVPFITVKNLTEGPGISFRDTKFISKTDHQEFLKRTHPEKGDVLITKDGTIGIARVVETDKTFSLFVSVALVKMAEKAIAPFFALAMNSEIIRSSIVPKGVALKHLHLVDLRSLRVPLPPLAEQHRIVAKVDELMILCDQLEAQLATSQTETRRLLEAVLHEALAVVV